MEYLTVLARLKRELPIPFDRGSAAETAALANFGRFFSDFSPAKVDKLVDLTYANDVWFNDTLKTIEGRDALRKYLRHSAEAVESCRVEILDTLSNATSDYFVRWTMFIRFKRFKPKEETQTIGMSHLRFNRDGLAVLHQDYWDATAGIFEHVPVLGAAIRAIKRRV